MRWVAAIACLALFLADASAQTAKSKSAATKESTAKKKSATIGEEGEKSAVAGAKTAATGEKTAAKSAKDGAATKKPAGETSAIDSSNGAAKGKAATSSTSKKKAVTESVPKEDGDGSTKGVKKSGASAEKKTDVSTGAKAPKSTTTKGKIDKPPQDNAGEEPTRHRRVTGGNITLDPADLAEFDANSGGVKRLLTLALDLTQRGLTYRYGSSDPSTGGMDCSGTIYYLLKAAGVKEPPRDSSGLYLWAEKEGTLRRVQPASLDDPAFGELRPGDLLFWEGTYEVQRDPPISHTMIYLGREKATGIRVMVGASDGRTYGGVRRNGVSVFDFNLPRAESAAKFVGYARVPGLEGAASKKR